MSRSRTLGFSWGRGAAAKYLMEGDEAAKDDSLKKADGLDIIAKRLTSSATVIKIRKSAIDQREPSLLADVGGTHGKASISTCR